MTEYLIFYSWQSDLPNSTNRGFIQTALENVAKSLKRDETITVEPVVQRDTVDLPGIPNIAEAIFQRISDAHVFVADVSIINAAYSGRATPNPNVLVELGYAMKALGEDRLVLLMNRAFGTPETLPFDLRMRRVISYYMPEDQQERGVERKQLEKSLDVALRVILERLNSLQPRPISLLDETLASVQNSAPNQATLVRRFMDNLVTTIDPLAPDFEDIQSTKVDLLFENLDKSRDIVLEFTELTEQIAVMNSVPAALTIYKCFGKILDRYGPPQEFSKQYYPAGFDVYKFLAHELFVTFVQFLIREQRWELLGELLAEGIYVKNDRVRTQSIVSFEEISERVEVLDRHSKQPSIGRISVHADILNDRHTQGSLSEKVPMDQFMEADYFLFLRSQFQQNPANYAIGWIPWSALYLRRQTPKFLVEAIYKSHAKKLVHAFGVESIEIFRELLLQRAPKLRNYFSQAYSLSPLDDFDINLIGTR